MLAKHERLACLFLSFFGVGYARWMPGTLGSLAAALCLPVLCSMPYLLLCLFWILALVLALGLSYAVSAIKMGDDPSWVVLDEVLAVWLIPVVYGGRWPEGIVYLWVLFRVFDIMKPWPISFFERRLPAVYAVYADDLVAMLCAVCVHTVWY